MIRKCEGMMSRKWQNARNENKKGDMKSTRVENGVLRVDTKDEDD